MKFLMKTDVLSHEINSLMICHYKYMHANIHMYTHTDMYTHLYVSIGSS